MPHDFHQRRVAAVRRAVDPDALLVDIRPVPQRLDPLGHVIHLGLAELEVDGIERALAHARRGARRERDHQEAVFGLRSCRR